MWVKSFGSCLCACLALLTPTAVNSQPYPNKPIRILTAEAGGGLDVVARLIAQSTSASLGQTVIVDNRGSTPSIELAARAPSDGYTLLVIGTTFWIGPLLQETRYDPVRDFAPVSMLTRSPSVLVVHPSLPVNSVRELIAFAKATPGVLNYASTGTGGSIHLATELFKSMAGVDILRISYKGNGQALNALIGGEVQVMFPTAGSVAPHVKSGRLKALAVTGNQTSALAPDLPTVASSGLPGYEALSILGLFAPAKTPATIINRLNSEVVAVLNRAAVKEKLFSAGVESVGSTPEQLAATMKSEVARMGKVIKQAHIRAD